MPERECWICDSTALTPVGSLLFELSIYGGQDPELAAYSGATLRLQRCQQCGFAQPEALPALDRYFDRMYDQRWSADWIRAEYEADAKDVIFGRILAGLEARLPAPRRRLLDVGAHAGRFIALARARGWQPEGLELNPQTAAYAARRTGATVRQTNVHDTTLVDAFDAITLTDVLEHVPRPCAVLQKVFELLAPGGCVAVKVPSGPAQMRKERWRGRLIPGYRPTVADNLVHVNHFSPAALALALRRAGFSDIVIRSGAPELPAGGGLRGRASRGARLCFDGLARMVPGGVHLPICFNLQAFARRPA